MKKGLIIIAKDGKKKTLFNPTDAEYQKAKDEVLGKKKILLKPKGK